MNEEEYREELQGVTYDMHRDSGQVPHPDVYEWYLRVGSDDKFLDELFCQPWNDAKVQRFVYGYQSYNEITPDMSRFLLLTMYTLKEWPEHK